MAKIAYVSGNGGATEFEIHRADCAHLKRARFLASVTVHTLEDGETPEDFVADEVAVYEDQDQGWGREDFRIFECVKGQK